MGYPKIFRNRRSYMLQLALAPVAGEAGYGLIYGDYNSSNPAMTCQHDDPLCAVCRPMLLFELYRPDSDQTKTGPIQALDHLASQHYQHVCSDPSAEIRPVTNASVVSYSPVFLATQCGNTDVQIVTNSAIAMYLVKYVAKLDTAAPTLTRIFKVALRNAKEYPSKADDAETNPDRPFIRLMQGI